MKSNFLQTHAAQPGYFLLYLEEGDSGRPKFVRQEPVIVWSIEGDNLVPYPITYDGVDAREAPLLRPDGIVVDLDTRWPSASAWLVHVQSDWDKHEELEREAEQKRYEAFLKQNGIQPAHDQVAQPAATPSPATTAVQAALAAARNTASKGAHNG